MGSSPIVSTARVQVIGVVVNRRRRSGGRVVAPIARQSRGTASIGRCAVDRRRQHALEPRRNERSVKGAEGLRELRPDRSRWPGSARQRTRFRRALAAATKRLNEIEE